MPRRPQSRAHFYDSGHLPRLSQVARLLASHPGRFYLVHRRMYKYGTATLTCKGLFLTQDGLFSVFTPQSSFDPRRLHIPCASTFFTLLFAVAHRTPVTRVANCDRQCCRRQQIKQERFENEPTRLRSLFRPLPPPVRSLSPRR